MTEQAVAGHSLLGTFVVPVAQALRQQGVDPVELVGQVGLDLAKAANPDWRVSQASFNELLRCSIEATGDEAFGLVAAK